MRQKLFGRKRDGERQEHSLAFKLLSVCLAILMLFTILPVDLMGTVYASGTDLTASNTANTEKIDDITWSIGDDDSTGVYYTLKTDGGSSHYMTASDGNVYAIPDGVSLASIKSIGMEMSFSIVEPDVRNMEAGDYVTFTAPDGILFTEAPETIQTAAGSVIASFSLSSDKKTLTMTFGEAVNVANYVSGIQGGFSLSMEVDSTADFSEAKTLTILNSLSGNSDATVKITFPAANISISGVKKTGAEDKSINGANWTLQIGTDAASAGTTLAGVTVTDTFDSSDMTIADDGAATLTATLSDGTTEDVAIEFSVATDETTGVTTLIYTFPEDTKAVAPSTITYGTYYTNEIIAESTAAQVNGADVTTEVFNSVSISGDSVEASDSNTATATASVSVTTVTKEAEQIDGNTMEWTLVLNKEENNVYAAVVTDTLMEGLTLDESYGIIITDNNTGESVTLTSAATSISEKDSDGNSAFSYEGDAQSLAGDSVTLAYTAKTSSSKQVLKILFSGTFQHSYTIVFRTTVSADLSANSEDDGASNTIDNQATVNVSYPIGGGTGGAGITYEGTTVEALFVSAYIKVTANGVDATTGILDWYAEPSSKTDYTTATITLNPSGVDSDQELYGTPKVTYKNSSGSYETLSADAYIYDATTYTFTFDKTTLTEVGVELSDLRISYQTKALNYFMSDDSHTYQQVADIAIAATLNDATKTYSYTSLKAEQSLQNALISKTVETVFDDTNNDAYFHFAIAVNGNGLTLNNVKVTDDLSSAIKALTGAALSGGTYTGTEATTGIDSTYYEVMAASTADYGTYLETADGSKTDTGVTVNGTTVTYEASTLSETATLHIYVKITDEGQAAMKYGSGNALSGTVLYADNTANIYADELLTDDQTVSANVKGLKESQVIANDVVTKSGEQGTGDEAPKIAWTININQAFADEGTSRTITDTIPSGLTIDRSSIVVSYGTHGENGSSITAGAAVDTEDYTTEITVKRDGTTTLTITFTATGTNASDETYVITYDTVINKSSAKTYTNSLTYGNGSAEATASASVEAKKFSWGSGYPKVLYTLTKLDSLSTSTNQIPIQGAHYAIYSDEACTNVVAEGYTDENGQLTFVVNQYDTDGTTVMTYYIKELESTAGTASDGSVDISNYEIDSTVYGPYKATSPGPQTLKPYTNGAYTGTTYFTDVRKTDAVGNATISKIYTAETDGISVEGLTSEFSLVVYPKAESASDTSSYKKTVVVTETAEGSYAYAGTGSAGDGETTTLVSSASTSDTDSNGVGSLEITGLPWGTYVLQETAAPDGFLTNSNKVTIVVDSTGTTTYYDNDGTTEISGTPTITNTQTKVVLEKMDSDGNTLTDYSQVSFTITGPSSDETPFVGETYGNQTEITLTGASAAGVLAELTGVLKAGVTYTVTESVSNIPYGYSAVPAFTVTINKNTGAVTVAGTGSTSVTLGVIDTGDKVNRKVTIKEPLTKLVIQKQDQNGDAVSGATLHIEDVTDAASVTGFAALGSDGNPTGEIVESISDWTSSTDSTSWNLTGQLLAGHTYRITEVSDVTGYTSATDTTTYYIDVTVGTDGTIKKTDVSDQKVLVSTLSGTTLTVQNQKIQADVSLVLKSTLKDSDGNQLTLTGATYDIYQVTTDENGNETATLYQKGVTTGANGKLTLSKVPEGSYYAVETATLTNYQLDETQYPFTVSQSDIGVNETNGLVTVMDGDNAYVTNTPTPVSITITDVGVSTAGVTLTNAIVGSTYQLYEKDSDGNYTKISTLTTEEGKSWSFTDLEWQKTYAVQQISVPDGYILDTNIHDVTAFDVASSAVPNTENTTNVAFQNTVTTVTFTKVDQNGDTISGAEFTLTPESKKGYFVNLDENGAPNGQASATTLEWTDSSNDYTLEGVLVPGQSYVLTETVTPEAYLDAEVDGVRASITITVGTDGTITVTDNGATSDGTDTDHLTAGVTNTASTLSGLGSTAYTGAVTLTNTKIYASATLTKVDATDEEKTLSGAKFTLYQMVGTEADTSKDTVIAEGLETDDNGEITVMNLAYGTYYFVEDEAPASYAITDADAIYSLTVTAEDHGKTITKGLTVSNERVAGSITITKSSTDADGSSVDGAEYTLYTWNSETEKYEAVQVKDAEGNKVDYTVSISDGTAIFTNLDWGTYYVKETKAPSGYTLDATYHGGYVVQEGDLNLKATVSDNVTSVKFHVDGIQSVDEDDTVTSEVLDGIEISVTGVFNEEKTSETYNKETTKTYTTDSDGNITVKNAFIVGNVYTVTATDPGDHYNVIQQYSFKVQEDGSIALTEEANDTQISYEKSTNVITMTARKSLFQIALTNTAGDALADGTLEIYEVTEDGMSETPVETNMDGDTAVYVTAVDSDENGVTIQVEGLMPGDYALVQTVAPEGYTKADTIYFTLHEDNTVTLTEDGEEVTLGKSESIKPSQVATITMEDAKTSVSISTTVTPYESFGENQDQEEILENVEIQIYTDPSATQVLDYTKEVLETPDNTNTDGDVPVLVTDEDGTTYILGLTSGETYYVRATTVDAENVILNTEIYEVEVGETATEVTIVSDVYRGDVTFTKVDDDDHAKVLEGSVYGIYRKTTEAKTSFLGIGAGVVTSDTTETEEEWTLLATATTDANGQITFSGLVAGVEYQIRELDEPSGYQVSKDPITVMLVRVTDENGVVTGTTLETVSDGNGTATISDNGEITWYEPRVKVQVNKLNEDGEHIFGAELAVIDAATGETVATWTTDGEGYILSGVLTAGETYILRELSAPEGYVVAEDITFTVEEKEVAAGESYIQQITMVDYETEEAAETAKEEATLIAGYNETVTKDATSEDGTTTVVASPNTDEENFFEKLWAWFMS